MIYLNNASTTKVDEKVLEDFIYATKTYWQNPSDVSQDGLIAKGVIEESRKKIAKSIGAKWNEIFCTSGASESNNWAIKGFLDKNKNYKTIITTKIEHPSVYRTCQYMENHGCKVLYAPVDKFGLVDLVKLEKLIVDNNINNPFVSIMFANNEIGTIQPIKEISNIVHKYNGVFHVDAVQAFMHKEIDVNNLGIDMMSTSFHKFGGFKNCGFLYIKDGIELTPLIHGGNQFNSKRAGTENVPMIFAMGNQVERIQKHLAASIKTVEELYNYTIIQVYEKCKDCIIHLNGHTSKRLYNNINFTFKGIDANRLIGLLEMHEIYVSAGSACCAGERTPSRVLKTIGLSNEEAFSTIRISIDENITKNKIDIFVDALAECIKSMQIFGIN